jgi:single-strand DNA-binding protein
MFHELTIVGNLGSDPEMRFLPDGTPVCNFSVASNRRWKNQDGSQGEETVWFRVTTWRGQAEVVNQYLTKGRQVFIKGRLTPDRETGGPKVFTRNNGSAGASYEVTATQVTFLGGAQNGSNGSGPAVPAAAPAGVDASDIPF